MTVLHRLSVSAQLTNCNVGPCWHVMAHIGACGDGLGRFLERCLYNHKKTGVQCLRLPVSARVSPLRPFPRVRLCPRNIPKLRSCMGLVVVVWIWAYLIIVLLFFGNMGVSCWVQASNRSANFAACPAARCYKKPERKPSWQRKPRFKKQGLYAWSGHLFFFHTSQRPSIISFDGHRILISTLRPP